MRPPVFISGITVMTDQPSVTLSIGVPPPLVSRFLPLFERGVEFRLQTNCSIKTLLCDHLGVEDAYVFDRIQTVFLNGKPVDDIRAATVGPGATIALSAAMPGLAGATLRSGGQFAAMRRDISFDDRKHQAAAVRKEKVTVKLFNHVLRELGPGFLERGVWICGEHLLDLIDRYGNDIPARCGSIQLDGRNIEPENVARFPWSGKTIFLTVVPRQSPDSDVG